MDAHKKMAAFLTFISKNRVLPLTRQPVIISAEIYAEPRAEGKPLDDMDLLIAGIAAANNPVLVTHNLAHFERIERSEIEDWSGK
uniref:tRNA(fMet)-specific endonuclease VapC n=1 Tax=Candidatus Kentrum sp. FW TaxID=2126338 RepID=A0A450U036_9GAMM|nr:MAG: tRNA(fMet)-specific endonuclease VapC [Candidatus Kentron sp. FW]